MHLVLTTKDQLKAVTLVTIGRITPVSTKVKVVDQVVIILVMELEQEIIKVYLFQDNLQGYVIKLSVETEMIEGKINIHNKVNLFLDVVISLVTLNWAVG